MSFRHLLFAVIALPTLLAAQVSPAPPKKLTVLIKAATPFVFDKDGVPAGYSIDLWKRLAEEAKLDFEFKPAATIPELIDALKANQADIGFGAISITSERESVIDFSLPFYQSGLQILVISSTTKSPFRAFLKLDVFKILGLLLIAIAINAHILWYSERGKDSESFPDHYAEGILNAAWWSVCILVTLGCENIAPAKVAGRLLGLVWMLAGVALYSYVTATLTSAMTVNTLQSDIKNLGDLQGQDVGTVADSSSAHFLDNAHYRVKSYLDLESACRALLAGELKAVIYDAPLLKYYVSTHPSTKLQLVGDFFEKQNYGFALPEKSPLRKEINRALLKVAEDGYLDELEKKWFAPAT